MLFRALRAQDIPSWRDIYGYCFPFFAPAALDTHLQTTFDPAHEFGLFDAGDRVLALMRIVPYTLWLGGERLVLGGVGGVATPPERRRSGLMSELMTAGLAHMYERHLPLSALRPFKQTFYRRYGYEVATAWVMHTIPVELLSHYRRAPGICERCAPGMEDIAVLSSLYNRWAAPRWGYIAREGERFWQQWVNSPLRSGGPLWQTALWRPAAGAPPEGYLLYRIVPHGGWFRCEVKELIALTPAAERGLWGYVAAHDSQVEHVSVRLPRDYPLWYLVENTVRTKEDQMNSVLQSGYMLRLVDLVRAFEERPWPAAAVGTVTITVRDEYAPWNQGTWRIAFEDGRARVTSAPAERTALSGDIQVWSQLYSAFVRPEQAVAAQRLEVKDPQALRLMSLALAGSEWFFYEEF